jgi:hypothetical protein
VDLDSDHVVVGVDGQFQRGLGATCGVGHQLLDQLFDIGKEGVEAGGGRGLGGQLACRDGGVGIGGKPGAAVVLCRQAQDAAAGQIAIDRWWAAGAVHYRLRPHGRWTWRGWPQSSRTQQPGLPVSSVASRAAFSVPVSGTTGIGVLATANSSPHGAERLLVYIGPGSRRAGGSDTDHARLKSGQSSELGQSGMSYGQLPWAATASDPPRPRRTRGHSCRPARLLMCGMAMAYNLLGSACHVLGIKDNRRAERSAHRLTMTGQAVHLRRRI